MIGGRIRNMAVVLVVASLQLVGCRTAEDGSNSIPTPTPPPTEERVVAAIAEARAAVEEDPQSADTWGHFGAVLDAHTYLPEAIQSYRRARALAPDEFRWIYHLAVTLDREAPDSDEILELFRGAATIEPRYPPVHYRLGAVLYREGRHEEAQLAFREALELDPDLALALRHLGQSLLATGNVEAALVELERSVAINPADSSAHSVRARAYSRLGRAEEARIAASLARKTTPEPNLPDPVRLEVSALGVSAFLAYKRGQIALENGRVEEAIDLFEIKDEVNPSASNHYFLGLAYRRADRPDDAAAQFQKALALADDADAHWQLGELLIAVGQPTPGLDHLRQAVVAGADDAELLHAVGASLAREGEFGEAIGTFERSVAIEPHNASLETDWCGALLQLDDKPGALSHCETAVALDPNLARARLHIGLVLESMNRAPEALAHYEIAVELDPGSRAAERLRNLR